MTFSDAPCPDGSNTSDIYTEQKRSTEGQQKPGVSPPAKTPGKVAAKEAAIRGVAIVWLRKGGVNWLPRR